MLFLHSPPRRRPWRFFPFVQRQAQKSMWRLLFIADCLFIRWDAGWWRVSLRALCGCCCCLWPAAEAECRFIFYTPPFPVFHPQTPSPLLTFGLSSFPASKNRPTIHFLTPSLGDCHDGGMQNTKQTKTSIRNVSRDHVQGQQPQSDAWLLSTCSSVNI